MAAIRMRFGSGATLWEVSAIVSTVKGSCCSIRLPRGTSMHFLYIINFSPSNSQLKVIRVSQYVDRYIWLAMVRSKILLAQCRA